MNHLWSPWRMSYILEEKQDSCVFCDALEQEDGCGNLIIHRGQYVYVILNRYPYTSGHLMVVPYQHCETLDALKTETRVEMMELINQCVTVLQKSYFAQGINIGANLGDAAGAGIPQHIHFHVVPRWSGDTNFMSAIGKTRVVPEALEESYQRILSTWRKLNEHM